MVGLASQFATGLVVMGGLSLVFAGVAWRKRDQPAARSLVVFQLLITTSLLLYAVDIEATGLAVQQTASSLWLVSQALLTACWVYVAIAYSGLRQWATRKTAAGLALEPLLFALMVAVPPLRRLLFSFPDSGTNGSIVHVGIDVEPLWYLHYGILFLFVGAGTVLFVQLFVRSRHLYRVQTAAVLVAVVGPWVTLLIGAFGFESSNDLSALSWSVIGIVLTVGLYQFKTLDPVPAGNETIVEQLGDGVIILDEDDRIGDFNPAARAFLGVETDENGVVGQSIATRFEEWDQVSYDDSGPTEWQELSLTVDGETRYVELQVSPFFNRFDVLVGRLVVLRDVTERTERERELARFKTIFESVSDRVYVLDSDGAFLMVNDPFATLVGFDADSLVGRPFETILATALDQSPPVADEQSVELTIETADGDLVPCEVRQASISFDSADTGSVGILRDVSRRKEIEASLQETTQQLETLVEASPQAIIGTDPDGNVEVWNDAAEGMFGWTSEELAGEFPPIATPEYVDDLESLYERVADGAQVTGQEMVLERKDGGRVDASVSLAPVTDDSGTVYGTVAVVTDITTQRERERTLQRQNERLDEFASLVSHDLRNPLQVARTHLDIVRHDESVQNHESVEKAQAALDRVEQLLDDSLALAREGRTIDDPRPIAIERTARNAWDNVQTGDARLELQVPTDTTIDGDPSRVMELFENLFRNAIEHGRDGDEREPDSDQQTDWNADTVFTRGADESGTVGGGNPRDQFVVRVETTDDGFAVEDNGPGLPDGEREALFEAGYTTAADGTGFGLAIVDRIAEAHGWTVSLTDGRDAGARIEFAIDGET